MGGNLSPFSIEYKDVAMTKLFFATDIHGSDICWSKFLNAGKFYGADVLILGGDMTGKAVVPFIHRGGKNYRVTLLEQEFEITNDDELQDMVKRVRSRGYYPYLTNPDEIAELEKDPDKVHQIFLREVLKVVQQWMDLADKKLDGTGMKVYFCPGNDDMDEGDAIVRASGRVVLVEGQVTPLDGVHEMIASGWSNRTPWDTHREEDEDHRREPAGHGGRRVAGEERGLVHESGHELLRAEPRVEALPLQQLLVGPLLDEPAPLHQEDEVRVADGGEALLDDERGPARPQGAHRALDEHLGPGVHRARRLVQHQDHRFGEERAGDGEQLLLTRAQVRPVLVDHPDLLRPDAVVDGPVVRPLLAERHPHHGADARLLQGRQHRGDVVDAGLVVVAHVDDHGVPQAGAQGAGHVERRRRRAAQAPGVHQLPADVGLDAQAEAAPQVADRLGRAGNRAMQRLSVNTLW